MDSPPWKGGVSLVGEVVDRRDYTVMCFFETPVGQQEEAYGVSYAYEVEKREKETARR